MLEIFIAINDLGIMNTQQNKTLIDNRSSVFVVAKQDCIIKTLHKNLNTTG